jgi:hypothetical protein
MSRTFYAAKTHFEIQSIHTLERRKVLGFLPQSNPRSPVWNSNLLFDFRFASSHRELIGSAGISMVSLAISAPLADLYETLLGSIVPCMLNSRINIQIA